MTWTPRWTETIESGDPAAWADLISFRPPEWIQRRLQERVPGIDMIAGSFGARVQAIENACYSINLDYYPIIIRRFPWNHELESPSTRRHTPNSLLELFRRNMVNWRQEALWDTARCEFSAFDDHEDARWADNPAGTMLRIAAKIFRIEDDPLAVDHGSIVCSEAEPWRFRVSTAFTPQDGFHPVSGNREWGMWFSGTLDGDSEMATGRHHRFRGREWTFYTRAADRRAVFFQAADQGADAPEGSPTFEGGHRFWLSMQDRFSIFINDNGGEALVPDPVAQQLDWDQVRDAHWKPTTPWVYRPR